MQKCKTVSSLIAGNINQVIQNKRERAKATFRIMKGNMFWLYNGKTYSQKQFNELLPISVLPNRKKGIGKDGTKEWIFQN
jgi:hypothetical protein